MLITRIPASKVFEATAVEMTEVHVEEFIQAERIAGRSDGYEFSLAVMSAACKFDGVAQPVEELRNMRSADFLELSKVINGAEPAPATAPVKLPGE